MATAQAGFVIALMVALAGCARTPVREYELRGQIMAIDPARLEVTIRHEDIPQFMPGMTMAFRVADKSLLEERVPGDLVRGTLVVQKTDAHLRTLEKTGFSPLDPSESSRRPMRILSPGEVVDDAPLVDDSGASRRLADFRGNTLAVTFTYTRCPLPTFCPLMDRHFKAVQDAIRADPGLASRVRLLSVSFDPLHDTPAVLAKHAARLQADPAVWRFLTGDAEQVDGFARQFGVSIMRPADGTQEIVHNLRTAIIDRDGRLITILRGAEWTPSDLVNELRNAKGEGESSR